ncbi:MAG: acyl carrier protein [Clostridia bacterium]|jgi:methoxymalonate biosynthesis acyl carrier protein|nr:acyl carrier protein [Clostridiaceae bacterium]
MDEIKKKVREFLNKNKSMEGIKDQDDLFQQGYVDSLFALQLIMFLEKEFKIRIKNKEIKEDNFRSVEKIAETVLRIMKK